MRNLSCIAVFAFFSLLLLHSACRKDEIVYDLAASGYPKEEGKLLLTRCAVSGCHNDISKEAAAGLSLSSWEKMFEGARSGAAVIPYAPDYSTLCIFTNTYPDLGPTAEPTMPVNDEPLTREEVLLLKNWIAAGAPNARGQIKFKDDPFRKKYYVTNQGCDVVTVIDAASGLQMRYIPVGNTGAIEAPHMVRVSPDGNYWYVVALGGTTLQKYRTADDAFAGEANIGAGYWNTLAISPDSRWAWCVDWQTTGKVKRVDLNTMTVTDTYQGGSILNQPHGSTVSPDGNWLYVTCQFGNYITKIDVTPNGPSFDEIPLDGTGFPADNNSLNMHDVIFSPDGSKYFVTCQGTSEVRVIDATNDQLIATIPVGAMPSELAFSETHPYMFVTCMEDTLTFPGKRGSVYVIDYNTNALVTSVYTGHQPHGLAVDDARNRVAVANRNYNADGPAPHHSTACGGRNGYVTFIDISTLELVPGKKLEIAVDPYSVSYRK